MVSPESLSPVPGRSGTWLALAVAGYLSGAIFLFTGFALHRSAVGVIGPYTPGYFAFLLMLAGALAAPAALVLLGARRLGARTTMRLVGGFGLLMALTYGAAEVAYAGARRHAFDPFLQFPGARFDALAREAPAGVVRVATLGGSTTHGAHLPPDERYPRVLERLLNEGGGPGYEVMNAGTDWWTSKHSHINYVTYVRAWSPEVVVVMHAINDLYRSFSAPRYALGDYDAQWSHFYGPAIRGAHPRTLAGTLLNSWVAQDLEQRWYARWRYQERDYPLSEFLSLPQFEESLRSLVRTLQGDGVRVILMTQPSIYRAEMSADETARLWFARTFCVRPAGVWVRHVPSPASMALAMETYNQVVIDVGRELGVEVLELAPLVPKDLSHFGDDVHYTAEGAALVANEVARLVRAPLGVAAR